MTSLITLHTPKDHGHNYGFFIPTSNRYLKVMKDSNSAKEEFQVMSQVCKETNSVPFYHHFYESKTSLLKKFQIEIPLPDDICAIEMEFKKGSPLIAPLQNPAHLTSILCTLMEVLEILYQHGCLYTDFNLSNFLIDFPTTYGALPILTFTDFTSMFHFNGSPCQNPSMDTCSYNLLCHSLSTMYGSSNEAHRTRVLFLYRMISVTALRFMGFVDVPLNLEHPELTLSPSTNYYQKVQNKLGEPLVRKIDFGFRFCGQIDEKHIFSKWYERLH